MMINKIVFDLPKTIKHKETKHIISAIVESLRLNGGLTHADIPQLHRLATAYDCYLECSSVISEKGMTMTNLKGEIVKRPEANLIRENWSQYLEIAKEYGFTPRSKKMTNNTSDNHIDTMADEFFHNN